ncbi:MAG: hypothetical protein NZ518_06115, partial [Dehalococcoidia bacterium]|nr:hypothetical protein [Dehalococcoidia bacterium]
MDTRRALRREGLAAAAAGLLAAPATTPLLGASYLQAHDGFAHLFRLYALDSALRSGVWYPRWSPELVFGLGYPIFTFYNPLVSYLAEAFHLAGLSFTDSLRALVAVATMVGAMGVAWWLVARVGIVGALLGAVAYAYAPYALLNIYVRAAFGEVVAAAIIPWALGLADRAFADEGRPRWWRVVGVALLLALILLAHNPSALVFAAILVVVVAMGAPRVTWATARSRALGLGLAFSVAFGVTAWFWAPFFAHLPDTWIGSFPSGVEDFYRALAQPAHLIQHSVVYDYDRFWESEQKVPLVAALVAAIGVMVLPFAPRRARPLGLAAASVAVAMLFLMTVWAEPIWRLAPVASLMSFPWRLLTGLSLSFAVLAAIAPLAARRWSVAVAVLLGVALVGTAVVSLQPNPLDIPDAQVNRATATRLDVDGALTGTTSPAQFVPRWVEAPVQRFTAPAARADAEPAARIVAATAVRFDGWQYELRLEVAEAGPARLRVFYFPGWQATINGTAVAIRPDGPMGEIGLDLPVGQHTVRVWYGRTWAHLVGEALSLVTVAGLVGAASLRAPSARLRLTVRVGAAAVVVAAVAASALRSADAVNPSGATMTEDVRLLGFRPDSTDVARRGVLRLDLLWLATAQPTDNYRVAL